MAQIATLDFDQQLPFLKIDTESDQIIANFKRLNIDFAIESGLYYKCIQFKNDQFQEAMQVIMKWGKRMDGVWK